MKMFIIAAFLAASCAAADAKPKAPIAPPPAPALPEFADAADAAKVLEAKTAAETARLRWWAALEEFERKYQIKSAQGDGWDEVGDDGKPCAGAGQCRLKIRRLPVKPPAPPAK